MSSPPVVILGCGFTGTRVAKLLLFRGIPVFVAARDQARLRDLASFGAKVQKWDLSSSESLPAFPSNAAVLHSVPDVSDEHSAALHDYITRLRPGRVVYLSTTSVYGSYLDVNAETMVEATDEKSLRRIQEEEFVRAGNWTSMILRPAAIYGPHRGVHTHVRLGREPRSRSAMVSRIHVDDLAIHAEAALLARSLGSYPVADEHPCSSSEISEFCRELLRQTASNQQASRTFEIPGRRVDGSEVRRLLGLTLIYPDYKSGILASLAEEACQAPAAIGPAKLAV